MKAMHEGLPPIVQSAQELLRRDACAPWWLVYQESSGVWGFPLPWDRPTEIGSQRRGRLTIGSRVDAPAVDIVPISAAFQALVPAPLPTTKRERRDVVLLNGVERDRLTLGDGDQITIGQKSMWFMDLTVDADDWLMGPPQLGFGPHDGSPVPRVWGDRIGPFLSDADLASHEQSRGSLAIATTTETLLALDDGRGGRLYPAFQFDVETAQPYDVLKTVVPLFRAARIDDFTAASWFQDPRSLLDAMTPADWMASHRSDDTLVQAARRAIATLGR